MLTENDIIDIIEKHFLKIKGRVVNKANTMQRGVDLEVKVGSITYYIEAKGETSSKIGTSNYGNPFTTNQIINHIARAIFSILKLQAKTNFESSKYIIAFPDTKNHRKQIETLRERLKEINIQIFLVTKPQINTI